MFSRYSKFCVSTLNSRANNWISNKLLYTLLSLFSSFLFMLIVIYVDFYANLQSTVILGILNYLMVFISLTNVSSGQILQKYLVSYDVRSKLTNLLLFIVVLGLLYTLLPTKTPKVIVLTIISASLINLNELFNVVEIFNKRPVIGALISLLNRLIVTCYLFLLLVNKISVTHGLVFMVITLGLFSLTLIFVYKQPSVEHQNSYLWRDLYSDIFHFNLVNWPVSIAQNIVRIFFYDGLTLSFKFNFEYLSKFISLFTMLFDYNIRFNMARLTNIILKRGTNRSLLIYLNLFKPYVLVLFVGIIGFSLFVFDLKLALVGWYLAIFNIFSFLTYARLIREDKYSTLFWALILICFGASSTIINDAISLGFVLLTLILSIGVHLPSTIKVARNA
jgi:hypothetical protein